MQVGELAIYLGAGQDLTSDEQSYLRALADQAAVAVRNSTMFRTAEQNAALVERNRLARDLHDSVSQALFSMTLHVRPRNVIWRRRSFATTTLWLSRWTSCEASLGLRSPRCGH